MTTRVTQQPRWNLEGYLKSRVALVEEALSRYLSPEGYPRRPGEAHPPRLFEAMGYSLFAGGKRLRPVLLLAATEAVGGEAEKALPAAAAIEMIHTYSLIHDDLPAMDNDSLRRGRPTNHVVYGEALAILAGDGLLTEAFYLLAQEGPRAGWDTDLTVAVIRELARAAGPRGMVGGQSWDILLEGTLVDRETLEMIHRHKTGALLQAAVAIGGRIGGAESHLLKALQTYGACIGLAFQIADDILDVRGSQEMLGKRVQKDARQEKNTFPRLMGVEASQALCQELIETAVAALKPVGPAAQPLQEIAWYVFRRDH